MVVYWYQFLLIEYHYFETDVILQIRYIPIHYKDYAAWQHEQLEGEELVKHKDYWLSQFEGDIPVLNLPSDNTRPAVQTFNGSIISGVINKSLSNDLNNLTKEGGGQIGQ